MQLDIAQPEYDVESNCNGIIWTFDLFLYEHGAYLSRPLISGHTTN